jgi:Na+-transporting methylmalonyl-CoA/oxaloacetate decarboxylase gamma subunit
MRAGFGFLSLILALWLVATLVQRQTTALVPVPAPADVPPAQKAHQIPQQVQEALDQALQQSQRRLDAATEGDR